MGSNATYDGEWTLSSTVDPFFLGNGKTAFLTSASNLLATDACFVTRPTDFGASRILYDNTVPSVVSGTWRLFPLASTATPNVPEIEATPVSNTLNMFNGINSASVTMPDDISVDVSRYAVRQYPYCTVQSAVVTAGPAYGLQIQHYVTLPADDFRIVDFTFSGNSFAAADGSLVTRNVLIGDGTIADSGRPISVGVLYEVADESVSAFAGFQMLSRGGRAAGGYPVFTLQAGFAGTFHALTCTMTGHDFANPHDEVIRCLLSLRNQRTFSDIRGDHSVEWAALWASGDVNIARNLASSAPLQERALKAKRVVRTCVYMMYSSVRANTNSQITSIRTSVADANSIDRTGDVLGGDDLWLLPAITLLNPGMAKSLVEYRFQELHTALNTARNMGFSGVRFPVTTDVTTASQFTSTWSPASNAKIFNTCLIALHAWNYYRVTQDDYYLRTVAVPILQGVAVFIASRVTRRTDNSGTYFVLLQTADPDGALRDNNFLDVFAARAAVRAALEGTWAVSLVAPQAWIDIANNGLRVEYLDANAGVLLPWTDFTNSNTYSFPPTLYPLLSFWRDTLVRMAPGFANHMLENNLTSALGNIAPTPPPLAINALVAGVAATVRNVSQPGSADHVAATTAFDAYFDSVLTQVSTSSFADLSVTDCAAVALAVLSGVLGVYVQGGLQSSGVPYSQLRVVRPFSAFMPIEWSNVVVKLPTQTVTATVINNTVT